MKSEIVAFLNWISGTRTVGKFLTWKRWRSGGWASPSPSRVKWEVLHRYGSPEGTWIETGTYKGDTTDFLAKRARLVISIEPSTKLADSAISRFRGRGNVRILNQESEQIFDSLLNDIEGDVSFWLDGHFSAGETFRGVQDTPIRQELDAIESHLSIWKEKVAIFIDDFRYFRVGNLGAETYPSRKYLVDFAQRNGLEWTIEHDIFCAWKVRVD